MMLIGLTGCGWSIIRCKRLQMERTAQERRDIHDAYMSEQKQLLKENTSAFMKEVKQIAKNRHPDSTRHQRRVVASRFRKQVKNS